MHSVSRDRQPDAQRRHLLIGGAAVAMAAWATPAQAVVEIEGVQLEDSQVVAGRKLLLNGAGLRRRGYFKADVTALYLPERRTTADAILKLDGPRRIQLNILREFSSSTISRIFISDFKQAATDEEFKKLIDVVSQIGAAYSNVKRVVRGDVVNLDWIPGRGWQASHNGKVLTGDSTGPVFINSELAYQIYMRMYIGPNAPDELRNSLLGLTKLHQAAV